MIKILDLIPLIIGMVLISMAYQSWEYGIGIGSLFLFHALMTSDK